VVVLIAIGLLGWVVRSTLQGSDVPLAGSRVAADREDGPRPPPLDDEPPSIPETGARSDSTEPPRESRNTAPRRAAAFVPQVSFVAPEHQSGRFPALFKSTLEPVLVELAAVVHDAKTPDGAVVELPAGFHEFSLFRFMNGKRFPTDLTIVGAGMDATILRLTANHESTSYVRLTFRNLTLDLDDEHLLATHRGEATRASIRFERCRLLNFGREAVIKSEQGLTVFATDSRFESGYGRSSEMHSFIYARRVLARFERCHFIGDLDEVQAIGGEETQFVSCTSLGFMEREFKSEKAILSGCEFHPYDNAAAHALRCDFLEAFTGETRDTELVLRLLDEYRMGTSEITRRGSWFDLFVAPIEGSKSRDVRFPVGVHEWDPRADQGAKTDGLVVRGVGRDKTLLVLRGRLSTLDVTFRDLTLDLGRAHIRPGGTKPVRLRFLSSRVIGFDTGAGGAIAFALKSGYVSGEDSEFLAGYGRSPDRSNLIRSSRLVLARFEHCLIRVTRGRVCRQDRYACACLDSCRLIDVNPKLRAEIEKLEQRRLLPKTTVQYAEAEKSREHDDPWPLSNLNPAWGKGRAR